MEDNVGLLHGSYGLSKIGGSTTSAKSSGYKPQDTLKFSDFSNDVLGSLPDFANGFDKKASQYLQEKTLLEQQVNTYNIQLESVFNSYGGNSASFFDDYEDTMINQTNSFISQKNQLMDMHTNIEKEYNEFEEGDLIKMDGGEFLNDNIGNAMYTDDILKDQELGYMLSQHQGATLGALGIDPVKYEAQDFETPADAMTWVQENKQEMPMMAAQYIAIQNELPYGSDFKDVEAINSLEWMDAFQDSMKGYGKTTIGNDGIERVVWTDSDQIDAGITNFFNNLIPSGPAGLRRTTRSMMSQKELAHKYSLSHQNEDVRAGYKEDFLTSSEFLSLNGYDSHDDILFNLENIVKTAKDNGNVNMANLFSDEKRVKDMLVFNDIESGGKILGYNAKTYIYQKQMEQEVGDILKSYYNVGNKGTGRTVQLAMQKAAQGDMSGYPSNTRTITTKDDQLGIVNNAKAGLLAPTVSNSNAENALLYTQMNPVKGENAIENSKKFFQGEESMERLSNYTLAKSKGQVFDNFVNWAKDNKVEMFKDTYISSIAVSRLADLDDKKIEKNHSNSSAGILQSGNFYNDIDNESFGLGVNVLTDGSIYERSVKLSKLASTDMFKNYIDNVASDTDRELFYDVNQYLSAAYQKTTGGNKISDYIKFNIEKEKGNYPVRINDISSMSDYSPLTGEDAIAGMDVYFNPLTLQEEMLPVSARILGVDTMMRGINSNDENQSYVTTWIAIDKDDLELFKFKDGDGSERDYEDIFDFDEYSFKSQAKKRPGLISNYFDRGISALTNKNTYGLDLGDTDKMMIISIPMKVDYANFWNEANVNKKLDLPKAGNQSMTSPTSGFPTRF